MANELCPRCGSEKTLVPYIPGALAFLDFRCPLDPKDCRIKELDRLLGEAKAKLYQPRAAICIWCGNKEVYDPCDEEAKARAAKNAVDHEQTCPKNGLRIDRDAALAESRKRGEEVLALTDAITKLSVTDAHERGQKGRTSSDALDSAWCVVNQALCNTSATVQETVQRIEREALEKAVARVHADGTWLTWHKEIPEGGSDIHFDKLDAAILGEKEKG